MSKQKPKKQEVKTGEGGQFRPASKHHTREHDVRKGRRRNPKHKKPHQDDGVSHFRSSHAV